MLTCDWRSLAVALAQLVRGGLSRLAALLCLAATGEGDTVVGREASGATAAIGGAVDSAGGWCWLAAALAQLVRGGLRCLAALLCSAAAGVGDCVSPRGVRHSHVICSSAVSGVVPCVSLQWRRRHGSAGAVYARGGLSRLAASLRVCSACACGRRNASDLVATALTLSAVRSGRAEKAASGFRFSFLVSGFRVCGEYL